MLLTGPPAHVNHVIEIALDANAARSVLTVFSATSSVLFYLLPTIFFLCSELSPLFLTDKTFGIPQRHVHCSTLLFGFILSECQATRIPGLLWTKMR